MAQLRVAPCHCRILLVLASSALSLGLGANLRRLDLQPSLIPAANTSSGWDSAIKAAISSPWDSNLLVPRWTSTKPAFLMKMENECNCVMRGACTCEATIEFMNCIASACRSGTCDCMGHTAFQSACNDVSAECPAVGLSCTIMHNAVEGKAMCRGASGEQQTVVKVVTTTPAPVAADLSVPEGPKFFPVPTTSRCIVIICCQYMLVFTALALCRTYHEMSGTKSGKAENALRAASQTVTYGPMLCVLFIACRLRVQFLSDGKDQPQMWVQNCMYGTTFALLATSLMVLIIPLVTGQPLTLKEGSCELEKPAGGGKLFLVLSAARYLIQLGLYGGIGGVIVGINTYTPPGQPDVSKLPKPAPAVMCTMILAVTFFVTQLVVAGCRSFTEFTGVETARVVNVMNGAADTVSFAPMLAILYLAARMRALQHDGQPQAWAQTCMYSSTTALVVTTFLAVAVPLILGGEIRTDPVTGQSAFKVASPGLGKAFTGVRYATILGMYVGAVGVIASIFVFEAPAGPEHTLPVSPTVQCVVNLCVQYFCVFLALNVMNTMKEFGVGAETEPSLQVTFVQATGLKFMNYTGDKLRCTLDVKHKDSLDKPTKITTKSIKMVPKAGKVCEPVWNETHELMWTVGDELQFTVLDDGLVTSATEGTVIVPSENFYPHGFAGEIPLSGPAASNGKLHVTIIPTPREEGLLSRCFAAVDAARATVTFAPMLSILFVTTRMYALQLTNQKGSPQAWVQDGMYMATWSLLISFVVCFATAAAVGKVQVDEDGNVMNKFKNSFVGIGICLLRYTTMVLLYGGIVTVVVGLFLMTPETANGRGSIPVVTDALSQTPLGQPSPGLNSVTLAPH